MNCVRIYSAVTSGLEVLLTEIEVSIDAHGFPVFTIVGLPDKSIDESKERVKSAIKNSGFDFPERRITVNLAPTEVRKKGSIFDLGVAVGVLCASEQIKTPTEKILVLGELSLDGGVRGVNGVLPILLFAKEAGIKMVLVPEMCRDECTLVSGITSYCFNSLNEVCDFLNGVKVIEPVKTKSESEIITRDEIYEVDFTNIYGQAVSKRALEIAASGGHNILLMGSPGSGKSLLSKGLCSILPSLTFEECVEVTKIYSVAGLLRNGNLITKRPFRGFHNSISLAGLVGGGSIPTPGEVSLAHKGVLSVDEFMELPRYIIESLRQPMEDGVVKVSRLNSKTSFPSKFMLVASCNPCPCGYYGDLKTKCKCGQRDIAYYQKKLSGPIIDRIDLFVYVKPIDLSLFSQKELAESSEVVRKRVQQARDLQIERFKKHGLTITSNSEISSQDIDLLFALTEESFLFLKQAANKFGLSMRAFHRVLKVSRTIADLDSSSAVELKHVSEALQYRIRTQNQL